MNTKTRRETLHAAGLCIDCKKPRDNYAWHCDACHIKRSSRYRAVLGYKAWVRGGSGRPPKVLPAP